MNVPFVDVKEPHAKDGNQPTDKGRDDDAYYDRHASIAYR